MKKIENPGTNYISLSEESYNVANTNKDSKNLRNKLKELSNKFVASHYKTTYDEIVSSIKKYAKVGAFCTTYTISEDVPKSYKLPRLTKDVCDLFHKIYPNLDRYEIGCLYKEYMKEWIQRIRIHLYMQILLNDGFDVSVDDRGTLMISWF